MKELCVSVIEFSAQMSIVKRKIMDWKIFHQTNSMRPPPSRSFYDFTKEPGPVIAPIIMCTFFAWFMWFLWAENQLMGCKTCLATIYTTRSNFNTDGNFSHRKWRAHCFSAAFIGKLFDFKTHKYTERKKKREICSTLSGRCYGCSYYNKNSD